MFLLGAKITPRVGALIIGMREQFIQCSVTRGNQRQFLENICSEDDLRSRIFGTFVVKFLACLSPSIFEHLKNGIIAYFKRIFTLKR